MGDGVRRNSEGPPAAKLAWGALVLDEGRPSAPRRETAVREWIKRTGADRTHGRAGFRGVGLQT